MATIKIPNCVLQFPEITTAQLGIPDAALSSRHFTATAGSEFEAAKLQHAFRHNERFGLTTTGTPVNSLVRACQILAATATINAFVASLGDTGTSTNINILLKRIRGGATTTLSTINFTHSDTDHLQKVGTVSDSALLLDDVLIMEVAVTSSTGALGPLAILEWIEVLT